MNRYFYIDAEGKQKGTFSPEELVQEGVKRDTLVWTQGMEQWKRAEETEELSVLFSGAYGASPAMVGQPPVREGLPGVRRDYPVEPAGSQADEIPPLKPNNWLWQSIVATLFCCIPLGVVGVIYAVKVDSLYFNAQYQKSEEMARKAKMWTLIAIGAGVLYAIFWVLLIALGGMPEYMENLIGNGASGYNF